MGGGGGEREDAAGSGAGGAETTDPPTPPAERKLGRPRKDPNATAADNVKKRDAEAAALAADAAGAEKEANDDDGENSGRYPSRRPSRRAAARVKKYEDPFVTTLKAFHASEKGKPLKIPIFCHVDLDLRHVYEEVLKRGGYEKVTADQRWLEVCRTLGHDLSGQTSAGFQMRQNYERSLLDYEVG